ncbi:MAG: hypothetical protein JO202_11715 [Ktedonobacteraceae bacterium]|nr:hypothetical protein [Ktedonobacteraceae bacterium]
MPWCRFFVPKMASPDVKAGEPDLNDHVMYAKCVKGHVLKDANDWILCENLPAPDAKCWQEGGDTVFSLMARQRNQGKEAKQQPADASRQNRALSQTSKS